MRGDGMNLLWNRNKKRKVVRFLFCFILAAFLFLSLSVTVHAEDTASSTASMPTAEEYYKQQMDASGANDLPDSLPDDMRKILDQLGVDSPDWKSISGLTPQSIFSQITGIAGEKGAAPLKAGVSVLAIMLLCALLNGMKLSFGEKPLGGVIGMVGTLCICTVMITPIVSCIGSAANVIKVSADFLLACVPVLTGIMIAGGQSISAGSYNLLMVGAGNVISLLAANIIVPLMNIFLAFSIVSAVSPNLNLSGLCDMFSKAVKWILGFCMTVFTGLMTLQSLVTSAADSTGTKAAKFVINSFVPVVGSALGEALTTVQGCVKLLKSGVGAFGLLAAACIFLPILLECVFWLITLYLCAGIGDVFDLKEITVLLRSTAKVLEMMLAIILSSMTILIVSTVLMLIIGGGSS